MRMSRLFPRTLYQAPAEATTPGHRLLLRAGLLRPAGAGLWAWLPLGRRVRRQVQRRVRRTLADLGAQEIALPSPAPAQPWEQAARKPLAGEVAFWDGEGRPLRLPLTMEPALLALLQPDLRSHRLLPLRLYQFRTRFDDTGTGATPLSARQTGVLELFDLQPDRDAAGRAEEALLERWRDLLTRCGLSVQAAETTVGPFAGRALFDPRVPGERPIAHCPACACAADLEVARRAKESPPPEEAQPLEEIATPDCTSIADVAAFLGLPQSRTAKAVFFVAGDRFFFVVVRGDMEVSEAKLTRLVGAERLRPAQEAAIQALGASPGYASPIGIRKEAPEIGVRQVLVVVDDLIPRSPNLVAGANREGFHLRNVTYGRDYTADLVADLAAVQDGDPCPRCGEALAIVRTTVLGRLWPAGTHEAEALGVAFQDAAGEARVPILLCADLELDRIVAACVEVHHDGQGLRWPVALAPFDLYLIALGGEPEVLEVAETLYRELQEAGLAVLLDDRDERAGVKFTDADLLGIPLRVAVSRRTLEQQGAEVKRRDQPRQAVRTIPLSEVVSWALRERAALLPGKE